MAWETSGQGIDIPVFVKGVRPDNDLHSNYTDPQRPTRNVGLFENEKNRALAAVLKRFGTTAQVDSTKLDNHVSSYTDLVAYITAVGSTNCHVHLDGTITCPAAGVTPEPVRTVPNNIRVHIEKGCLIVIAANTTFTILNIESPPDFAFMDLSASGSKVVLGNDIDYNPKWNGAHGDGVTDDADHFAALKRSLDISGNERWMVINHNHLLNSNPAVLKMKVNAPNGKITHGFDGAITFNEISCNSRYHNIFICSTTLRYVTFANQGRVEMPWFGAAPGSTSTDFGKSWTLASKSMARICNAPYGLYYTTTSAVGYGMQSQLHTCDPGTAVCMLATTARSFFRRVCGWPIAKNAPIVNNGSGYVRIKFLAPLLEPYCTIVLRLSGVSGYNTSATVTAVGYNYIDCNILYTSDSTCTVDLMDGTNYATGMIIKGYTFLLPQTTVSDQYFCLWFGVEYSLVSYYLGRGVSELVIDDINILTNNASVPSQATGIRADYATLTKIKDVLVNYCHIGIDIRASTCVQIVGGKIFHCDIQVFVWGCIGFYSRGMWMTMSEIAYLVQHDSALFRVENEVSEHGGVIVFQDCRAANFEIAGATYFDVAHRIAEFYSSGSENFYQGVIRNCILGVAPDSDPGKLATQQDVQGKKSCVYGEFYSESGNQVSIEHVGYNSEDTGGFLPVDDYVVMRLNNGQRLPSSDLHIVKGQFHNLGTQVTISKSLNPGTIAAGSAYTYLAHTERVDETSWFVKDFKYTKIMSTFMRIVVDVINDSDNIITGVTLSNNIRGNVIASKPGIASTLDTNKMVIVVSGSDTLDGTYQIEPVDSGSVKLIDSDYGVHTYEVTFTIDYTRVPTTQTVPVVLNFATIPSDDDFWKYTTKDGGNIRAYNESGTQLPLDIIEFNRDTSLYLAGRTGRGAVLAEISHTQDTKIILRTGRWSLKMPDRGSTYGGNAVWAGYNFAINNGKYYIDDTPDYTAPETVHGIKRFVDSSGNYDPMAFNDQINTSAVYKPGFGLYRPYGQGYHGVTFGDKYNPGATSFAFTTWVLCGTQSSTYTVVLAKWYLSAASGFGFAVTLTSAGVLQLTTSSNGSNTATSTWSLPTGWNNGQYHHLVMIKSGTDAIVYWNGNLLTRAGTAPHATIYANTHALTLQSGATTSHDYWMPTANPASILYNPRFIVSNNLPTADYFLIQRLCELDSGSCWKTVVTAPHTDTQTGSITPKTLRISMINTRPSGGDSESVEAGILNALFEYRKF